MKLTTFKIRLNPVAAIKFKGELTSAALAELIDVSPALISYYGLEARRVSLTNAQKLIKVAKKMGLHYVLEDFYEKQDLMNCLNSGTY